MKITNIEGCSFSLPFKSPLKTSNANYTLRQGILLVAQSDHPAIRGVGELAPLEEFSFETLSEAQSNLEHVVPLLIGQELPNTFDEYSAFMLEIEKSISMLPSVRWAIDMLLCDMAARMQCRPLSEFINPKARRSVPINGILGGKVDRILDQLCKKVVKEYPVYKIKIRAKHLDRQIETLTTIRNHLDKKIPLRLDCNQGLEYDEACSFLNRVSRCGIEYVEEPLKNPTPQSIGKLRAECPIPIALDESLEDHILCEEMVAASCFDVMVLKPMLLGGISETYKKARIAADKGLKLVLTSTLESGVGLAAGVHTAAAVPSELLPCGFDTAGLFTEQLDEHPLAVVGGAMTIPERPGLGVVLKHEVLNQIDANKIANA